MRIKMTTYKSNKLNPKNSYNENQMTFYKSNKQEQ